MDFKLVKNIITVVSVLLFSSICNSQEFQNWGFNIGGSLIRMGGEATEDTDVKNEFGFCLGLFTEIKINNNLSIQPELQYLKKGMKYDYIINDGVNDGIIEEKLELSYIEFPLLMKYKISTSSKINPSIFVGPAVSLNISGKSIGRNKEGNLFPWDGGNYGWDGDIANIKDFELGGIIGLGLNYPINNVLVNLDLRYDFSFSSAFEEIDNYGTPGYDPGNKIPMVRDQMGNSLDLKNRSITFNMGIVFPI